MAPSDPLQKSKSLRDYTAFVGRVKKSKAKGFRFMKQSGKPSHIASTTIS
jgi:hypothetical protein